MRINTELLKQQWKDWWTVEAEYPHQNNLRFFVRIGFLITLYFCLNFVLKNTTKLPITSYESSFITLEFVKHLPEKIRIILLFPLIVVFGICWRKLGISWNTFTHFKPIRFLTFFVVLVLAWVYVTYDYNLYYNQSHLVDRLLLLCFVPLIWWRPIFVFPFLFVLYPMIGQFTTIIGFSWTIPLLPIHLLVAFCAFFLFYLITKSQHITDFLFFAGVVLITHYWNSGYHKVNQEWLLYDQVQYLLPATYPNGWLGFLSAESIGNITEKVAILNTPIKILVILIEFGCVFFFLHRKLARLFLIGLISFHIGILLISGIFFWVWMLIDISFLILLFRKDGFAPFFKFNRWQILFSIFLIVGSRFWSGSMTLYWHDVPMSYTYLFEAENENGETYRLPPQFFAPYDYQFTLSAFSYLNKNPVLPIIWGATNKKTTQWFRKNTPSKEEIFQKEQSEGILYYSENSKVQFEQFLQEYIKNWNERLSKRTAFSLLKAPEYLWTFPRKLENKQKIEKIKVFEVAYYYQNGKYKALRKRPVQVFEFE